MDQEFQEYDKFAKRMEEQFPLMFAGKYGGFSIGKGWYPIIESLCSNIQHHIDWKKKQNKECLQVTVEQIKEKFGGLRFYYQGGDEEISGMVRMAEAWAGIACEECGGIGKRTSGGWIRTLCDFHVTEQEALRSEEMKKNGYEE